MDKQKLKILSCGGTIDKIYFDSKSEFQVGEPQIVTVLRESNVTLEFEVESILKKDSLDMTDADRKKVLEAAQKTKEARILITHGTDTMIDTAKVLSVLAGKTIVLTGSMEPAKFKITDAAFNIGCAIAAVQILPPGVYIAMNGKILNPSHAKKNVVANRFEETS